MAIPGLAGGFIIFGCFGGKIHGDSWFSWWFHHLWFHHLWSLWGKTIMAIPGLAGGFIIVGFIISLVALGEKSWRFLV